MFFLTVVNLGLTSVAFVGLLGIGIYAGEPYLIAAGFAGSLLAGYGVRRLIRERHKWPH